MLELARERVGGRPQLFAACALGSVAAPVAVRFRLHWPVASERGLHTRLERACTRRDGTTTCDAPQHVASLDLERWFTVDAGLSTHQLAELMAVVPGQLRPGEVLQHVGFAASPQEASWSVQTHGYTLTVARPPLGVTGRLRARLSCTDRCRWLVTPAGF